MRPVVVIALAALLLGDAATAQTSGAGPVARAGGSYDTATRVAAFQARYAAVRPGALFPVSLPTPPVISRRITVSTAAEMQAVQGQSGVEVTFTGAGFTGTLRPGADQRWVFPVGFTLTAPPDGYAIDYGPHGRSQRVELVGTGGQVVGGTLGRPTDLRLRGMDLRTRPASPQVYLDTHELTLCSRVLIEGSRLVARSYALIYSDCNNVVVANSEVIGAGEAATSRGARNDLVLWLDSRLVTQGSQMMWRAHEDSNRVAVFATHFEGSTGVAVGVAGVGGIQARELVLLDNVFHVSGQSIAQVTTSTVGRATIVGNRAFTNWEQGVQIPVGDGPGWIVGSNARAPAQPAPAWRHQ